VFLLQLGAVAFGDEAARASETELQTEILQLHGAASLETSGSDHRIVDTVSTVQAPMIAAAASNPTATPSPRPTRMAKHEAAPTRSESAPVAAIYEPDNREFEGGEATLAGETSSGPQPKQGIPDGLLRRASDDSLSPQGTGAWKLLVDDKSIYKMPDVDGRGLLTERSPRTMRLFARRRPSREFPMTEISLSVMALLAVVFGRSMLAAMRRRKADRGFAV
jgi:hypothetical protein